MRRFSTTPPPTPEEEEGFFAKTKNQVLSSVITPTGGRRKPWCLPHLSCRHYVYVLLYTPHPHRGGEMGILHGVWKVLLLVVLANIAPETIVTPHRVSVTPRSA
jgi:hypothetical protein